MKTDVHGFLSFTRHCAQFLIILACFASARAATLQDAVIKNGCSIYQDPKTIEPLKKYVEPAMKQGCVACHLDCDQLSPANQKDPPEHYLKAQEPELCMECHALDKTLLAAHDNQPLGKSKCTGCHEPHSSDVPKLLLQSSHGPYAARLCSACHPAAADGKVGLTAANVDTLCYNCHTSFKAQMAGLGSQHKLLSESDRACMECHDPHASNQEYVLKQPVHDLCLDCHIAKPGQTPSTKPGRGLPPEWAAEAADSNDPGPQYLKLSSKYVHEPAQKSCLICHDAHASKFPRQLRVSARDLCMDCHGPNSEKIVQSNQPFPLFDGLVSLPAKTFEKLTHFEFPGKYVHEPVNMSCALCHDAHGSDHAMGLYAPVQDVCLACHGPNAMRMYQTDQPYPLFGGRVIVPPRPFDNLRILNLQNSMLGHPTSKHPVSGPATEDYEEFTCATCHSPHASTGPKLLVTDKDNLCSSSCHDL